MTPKYLSANFAWMALLILSFTGIADALEVDGLQIGQMDCQKAVNKYTAEAGEFIASDSYYSKLQWLTTAAKAESGVVQRLIGQVWKPKGWHPASFDKNTKHDSGNRGFAYFGSSWN